MNRQAWQLCQAGYLDQCERTLRSQIDDETRILVEADREFARDKVSAHIRLLLSACDARSNVRACDRALSYNLSASERQEVLTMRKSVIQRGVIRVNRQKSAPAAAPLHELVLNQFAPSQRMDEACADSAANCSCRVSPRLSRHASYASTTSLQGCSC